MRVKRLTKKLGRRYTEIARENSEEEIKINFINLSESVGRGVIAGEDLNLGERKNNLKRKERKNKSSRYGKKLKRKKEPS